MRIIKLMYGVKLIVFLLVGGVFLGFVPIIGAAALDIFREIETSEGLVYLEDNQGMFQDDLRVFRLNDQSDDDEWLKAFGLVGRKESGKESKPLQEVKRKKRKRLDDEPIGDQGTIKERFECDQCKKTFKQKRYLKNHYSVHTGEKPFECINCGKNFRLKRHLSVHEKIHKEGRLFKCNEKGCNELFFLEDLKKHKQIHMQKRPFECEVNGCEKRFSLKNELTLHKKIHTGKGLFICAWGGCGKKFIKESILNNHKRVHTGEKPFVCDYCGKKFARKANLTRHQKIHEKEIF